MDKNTQEKIMQLQSLEQNLQHILIQKQTMQTQLIEIDAALQELNKTKKQAFKIIGAVMVESSPEDLIKDLKAKKEILEVKVKNFEKQEEKLKKNAQSIQEEVIKTMEKNE